MGGGRGVTEYVRSCVLFLLLHDTRRRFPFIQRTLAWLRRFRPKQGINLEVGVRKGLSLSCTISISINIHHPSLRPSLCAAFRDNLKVDWSANGSYSTELYTQRAIDIIRGHHECRDTRPLFIHLAYEAPHVPVQVRKRHRQALK